MKIDKRKLTIEMAKACMTASEIQEVADIPRGTYIKAASGKSARPATIGKFAKALNCNVTDILAEEEC